MRILICGDRDWKDEAYIESVMKEFPQDTVIIHGACRGADKIAESIAKKLNMEVIPYPAKWKKYGLGAGIIRNKQMLDEGKPDKVIAFHHDLSRSKGTKNMLEISEEAGIPFKLYQGGL